MPTFYQSLPDNLHDWALAQPVFFTATAPTHGAHINVSPKGHTTSSFAILSPNRCAYLDATGSGCETAAHLHENGRITLMWLSFGASPRIMRLFGRGRVIERGGTGETGCAAFEEVVEQMRKANGGSLEELPVQKGKGNDGGKGWRGVVVVDFFKVQTSCGWGVPVMTGVPASQPAQSDPEKGVGQQMAATDTAAPAKTAAATAKEEIPPDGDHSASLDGIRKDVARVAAEEANSISSGQSVYRGPPYHARVTLANFMAAMSNKGGEPGIEYQAKNNSSSLDGLPGYQSARMASITRGSVRDRARNGGTLLSLQGKVRAQRLWSERQGFLVGWLVGVLMGLVFALGVQGAVDLMQIWAETARGMASK